MHRIDGMEASSAPLPALTLWRRTAELWAFAALKIPLVFFLRPRVLALTDRTVELKLRLGRRTRNHWGSMYFGALATGAELVPGIFCAMLGRKLRRRILFAVTHLDATFMKPANGDVVFSSNDGETIATQIANAAPGRARLESNVEVLATSLTRDGRQPVATFRFRVVIRTS